MADLIDVSLSLNEEQFTRLKKELVDARPPFWKSEALLRTVQILAIVVGGCWVLIQFLLYERGKIELETKKVTAEIEESELRAQLNEIKKEKDKFNLTSLKTYRVDYSQDIQVEYLEKLDDVYSLFKLTADFKIKNTSKTEFELSLWVLDYYVGNLRPDLHKQKYFIEELGSPPNRWNPGSSTGGAVIWERVGSSGAIYGEAAGKIAEPWNSAVRNLDLKRGGGGTGKLGAGENMNESLGSEPNLTY